MRKERDAADIRCAMLSSMKRTISKTPRAEIAAAPSEAARWQAVLARDASTDGTFYYSVETTGVYCRPSCSARRPLRQNVRFHATCADAEAAGFRACKRCRPCDSRDDGRATLIAAACRQIEGADTSPDLEALATKAGLSRFHFQRLFKAVTGVTPKAYASAHRNERARAALGRSASVTEAVYAAGFQSSSRFYEGARNALGMPPNVFRAGGRGMNIRHAMARCSLGLVLVGTTDVGVCAIFLGDDEEALRRDLSERFPNATLTDSAASLGPMLAEVVAGIEMPEKAAALPLDIRGTAFQHLVWSALRDIPLGETATYGDIARRIGKPNAVRAVGAACGANPVAVAVPCHRVVGTDGKLTGYRWGVERKRALLARERK